MRKWIIAGVVLLMSFASARAGGLALYGSYWSPDELDAGFGGGAKAGFDLADMLELELRGTYFPEMSEDTGRHADFEIVAAEAGLRLKFPLDEDNNDTFIYVGAGGGYYFLEIDSDEAGVSDVDVDDEIGWYGLGGIELALSDDNDISLFAEAQYRFIEATVEGGDLDETDDEVDIDLNGIGANAGIVILW
jgi:hypothetical protein